MKIRETFLRAVVLVQADQDAREAWTAMNRKNAPWAAVFEGDRLVGLLDGRDLERALAPEVFLTAGELAAGGKAGRRAIRLSPGAVLEEALAQLELAGADAGFVEGEGRPPGVLVRGAGGASA